MRCISRPISDAFNLLCRWLVRYVCSKPPGKVIGTNYMLRWYLIPRNRFCNVYVHRYLGSDDDRAEHDHPWWSLSYCVQGAFIEVSCKSSQIIFPRRWRLRDPLTPHRLVVLPWEGHVKGVHGFIEWGDEESAKAPTTIFLTGPRIREWGFHCPQGWRHWRVFTDPDDSGRIGRGCD